MHFSSLQRKQVAILGAAFDPIHYGHCFLATRVLKNKNPNFDEVWLCPSPPRWDKKPTAASTDRLRWVEMAAKNLQLQNLPVKSCNLELAQPAYRGSLYFLNQLTQRHPNTDFTLIAGQDAFAGMLSWRDPVVGTINGAQLLAEFPLVIVERRGSTQPLAELLKEMVEKLAHQQLSLRKSPLILSEVSDLSSTRIRYQIKSNAADFSDENEYPIFKNVWEDILASGYYL